MKTYVIEARQRKQRTKKIMSGCGCVCFCNNCREPLNDNSEFLTKDYGVYQYTCSKCGTKCVFDFVHFPCPVRLA
jgi:heterodisulfide reductase subunit B